MPTDPVAVADAYIRIVALSYTESIDLGVRSYLEDAKVLAARVRELEAAQRWIPVTERLPEVNKRIWMRSRYGGETFSGRWTGFEWKSSGLTVIGVTHWQEPSPLPALPEVTL